MPKKIDPTLINDPDDKFTIEKEPLEETGHASRVKDMLLMRSMKTIPQMEPMKDMLVELNMRYVSYVGQFPSMSHDNKVLQTVQDFNRYIIPLQAFNKKKKSQSIDPDKPVASLKDGTFIYAQQGNSFETFVIKKEG